MSYTRTPLQIIATGTVVAKTIREWEGKMYHSIVVCVPGEWDQYLTIGVRDDVYADIPLKCEIEANAYVGGRKKEKDGQIIDNPANLRMGKYTVLSASPKWSNPHSAEAQAAPAPAQSAAPNPLAGMTPEQVKAVQAALAAMQPEQATAEPLDDLPF